MTREEIMRLDAQGLETRMAGIRTEMNDQNADIPALSAEVDAIEERRNQLREARAQRQALETRIASGAAGTNAQSLSALGVAQNETRDMGPQSAEYRTAWLKNIAVRSDGTAGEEFRKAPEELAWGLAFPEATRAGP